MARKRGRTWKLLLVALLLAIPLGADWFWRRIDRWRYPWGYDAGGRATLTGTWVGPFTTLAGHRSGGLLDLKLTPFREDAIARRKKGAWRGRNATTLDATARMCDARGELRFSVKQYRAMYAR